MKILNVSQAQETEAWLEARIGRITGTKATGLCLEPYAQIDVDHLREMKRKTEESAAKAKTEAKRHEYEVKAVDYERKIMEAQVKNQRLKVTAEFWRFLAEKWAEPASGENPMERGHRLEPVNIAATLKKLDIPETACVTDTGMWLSDTDDDIACSPDAYERAQKVTWAIECKSLNSATHLQTVVPYLLHRKIMERSLSESDTMSVVQSIMPDYVGKTSATGLDFVPDAYKRQCLQYFVVNTDLDVLFFSLYDDRLPDTVELHKSDVSGKVNTLAHTIIPITRSTVQSLIDDQERMERKTLATVGTLREELGVWF